MSEYDSNLWPETPRPILGTTTDGTTGDFTSTFEFSRHPNIDYLRKAPVLCDLGQLGIEQTIAAQTPSSSQLLFYRAPDLGLYFRLAGKNIGAYGQVYDCQEANASVTVGRRNYWEGGPPQIKKDCYLRLLAKGESRAHMLGPIISSTEPIPNIEAPAFWEL